MLKVANSVINASQITGVLPVLNGGTGVTTSTGTTNVVLSNSPTLVTPALGVATATSLQGIIGNVTPAAGTFTTLTGIGYSFSGSAPANSLALDASGNLLVGKTSSGTVNIGVESRADGTFISTKSGTTGATETMIVYSTGAGDLRFYVSMNGTVNATNATISAISDIRFKENVRDLNVGLDKIMALKPRLYDWKEGKGANIKNARGFIAQEFETVFPDLIDEWKDPAPEGEDPYKSVRQDLMPVLVKAIQEQQSIIETLKQRITVLERK